MGSNPFYSETLGPPFMQDGIVATPMLGGSEIKSLLDIYQEASHGISGRQFHSTMFVNNEEYRKKTSEQILQIINKKINAIISGYRVIFANFIVKEAGGNTYVGIHQDWNFTSPEFTSINLWIPLVDITTQTGAFYALKGSHRTFRNLRYTPYEDDRYRSLESYIKDKSVAMYPKAGEALIYDGALVHFSDPNLSSDVRIAIGAVLIPVGAPNFHYYKRDPDKKEVEVYEVDDTFYHSFDFFDEPKGVSQIGVLEEYFSLPTLYELNQSSKQDRYPVFKDPKLEQTITDKGYVVISNLIPEAVCDDLISFYEQHEAADDRAFTISNWNNDRQYRKTTFEKIYGSLRPYEESIFNDFKPVMGVFTAKKPMTGSDMLLHQDWSLVDETQYRSVSIWVALCDMDSTNGNLQVAEYSHLYASQPRGMNIPVPFDDIRSRMHRDYLTDVPLRKGDAIVFDHRLIHASPENGSAKIRLAAVLALIPSDAELIHYYMDQANDKELEILKMDENEFFLIDFFDQPNRPKHMSITRRIPFLHRRLSIEDIDKVYK